MNVTAVRREGDDYGPLEIQLAQDYKFEYSVTERDKPVPLADVKVEIRQGGNKFVEGALGNVSSNVFDYTFEIADQPPDPTQRLLAIFSVVVGGVGIAFQHREGFDIVRNPLRVPITEDDLFQRFPQLREDRALGREEGFASASSTTTDLVAVDLIGRYEVDFYAGGELWIIDGTNTGAYRDIVSYDPTTGTVVVSNAFEDALDATSKYRIRRSWMPIITEAWADMKQILRNRGRRPALVTRSIDFRPGLMYQAAGLAFAALSLGQVDDPNQMLADTYAKKGTHLFDGTLLEYDEGDTGDPNSTIKAQVTHVRRR